MSESASLCFACMCENVIATLGGPTCTHGDFKWPEGYAEMTEEQRCAWWQARQKPQAKETT